MKYLLAFTCLIVSSTSFASNKAVYGSFDNEFISKNTPALINKMSTGIAYLSPKAYLYPQANGQSVIAASPLGERVNLCANEPFAKNLGLNGTCTGFLIAPDILLTAGHCISTQSSCDQMQITFGVTKNHETSYGFMVSSSNVYQCERVLKYSNEPASDYSIVKLNRKVKNRHIFSLGDDSKMSVGSRAFMIGHPIGMAQTYSKPAPVVNTKDRNFLKITLDSFGGNSGGPVIDVKTSQVIGLLIRGATDFQTRSGQTCRSYALYPDNGYGEWVYRINEVKEILKNYQIL